MTLTMAWIYPGPPACNANMEYSDGRKIDVLRVQYHNVTLGVLSQINASGSCNGYSAANVADLKKYSTYQYDTLSFQDGVLSTDALANSASLQSTFNTTIVNFLSTNGMTGADVDSEGYGAWTATNYANFKKVMTSLGNALHTAGKKLMICGPAILDSTTQGYFPNFRWEDFNQTWVDYLTPMCYDFQDDYGGGTPVASLAEITSCCNWMKAKITDQTKIVIGINSYGYVMAGPNDYSADIHTYSQSQGDPGFSTASRDTASGEMMWVNGGNDYDYSDAATLDGKQKAIYATGLANISVWHLGGNLWFSGGSPPPPPPPPPGADFPTQTIASDTFVGRTVASGLGTASDAEPWSVLTGTSSHYSVSASQGHYSYDAGLFSKTLLGYGVTQDIGLVARFLPGSSTDTLGFYCRGNDANNNITASINASHQYSATITTGGTPTSFTGSAVTVTAGVYVWLRVVVIGPTISMRYWNDGTTEPTTWGATFTTTPTPWIGQYGLYLRVGTTATSIVFDNFSVANNITTVLNAMGGFIYPGSHSVNGTTSDVPTELADGRRMDWLKPQYYSVGDGYVGTAGVLVPLTVAGGAGWDSFSATNTTLVKNYSTQQFITVGGREDTGVKSGNVRTALSTLAGNNTLLTNFCSTLVTFCTTNGFTGIELDLESSQGWLTGVYGNLKTIVTALGNALHAATPKLKLMLDGPGMVSQGVTQWHWEDFNALPVDYWSVLAYDEMYDVNVVGSAQTPVSWLNNVIAWTKSKATDTSRIVMSITSQAYHQPTTDTGFTAVTYFTYSEVTAVTGFSGAVRDVLSGEMMFTNGGISYCYLDKVSMNTKLAVLLAANIVNINVWFLGGANQWFSVIPTVVVPPPPPPPSGGGGTTTTSGITLTTAGLNLIRDGLAGVANPKITYVALGTGTNPPLASDTALQSEAFRKAVTSYTNGSSPGEVVITMYLAPSDAPNLAINEFGFYGGAATATANSGTLLARGLYAHTHVNTESIQFTLDFTA